MKTKQLIYLAALSAGLLCAGIASADPFIINVSVGPQSPAALSAGGTATYTVSLTKTNSGSIVAYLSISNLPSGATASFSTNPVLFSSKTSSSQTSTLSIATSASLADGTYPFTVISRDGGSGNTCTGTGTLIVGNGAPQVQAPLIVSISLLANKTPQIVVKGSANAQYQILVTSNLGSPSWASVTTNVTDSNGLFSFTDLGSAQYPTRFYRAATVQ